MLSVKRIGGGGSGAAGAAAMAAYYEGEVRRDLSDRIAATRADPSKAADEYLAADPQAPLARWWSASGKLAPDGAPIVPGQLRDGLNGLGLDGSKLVQDAARNTRVGGWDLTFSAPKDVSVLYAAADPATRRTMLEDVAEAAKAGLRSLHEAGVFETRRGKGGAVREVAADVSAAVFPQATSRAGEPQLHAHAVVINAARRADETTGALDPAKLYPFKTYAAAVFRAELAHRLEQRGLAVEQDGQAFRVVGAPRELAEAWSTRRGQVIAAAGAGDTDGKAKRLAKEQAAQRTRRAKDTVPRDADLEKRWAGDMDRFGLSPAKVWGAAREAAERHQRPERTAAEAAAAEALERHSVVTERELRRLVAEATQTRGGGASAAKAEADRLLTDGRLLELGRTRDGERVFSTRGTLERERRMILDAMERREEAGSIRAEATEAAIAKRPSLSDEQAAAVRHATGRGGVVAVEGLAGTGKSYALGAVAEAAQESGAHVVALAPSWQAAEVLSKDTGLPARALQGFARELDRGEAHIGRRDVVLVDEAGMAGSTDVAKVLAHAREAGAKVILSGDRRQLRSVEPGAAFASLADTLGVGRIETVRRQDIDWQREAAVAFGNGNAVDGLARYDAKNRIVYAKDAGDAMKRLGEAWEANRKAHPDASRLVLAGRNAEVHALNAKLRSRAMVAGDLGADAITLRTMHAGGRRGGQGEAREMEVRTGDRVAVGATLKKRGLDVLTNDVATVQSIKAGCDPALTLRLDRTGKSVTLRASDLAPPARKGQDATERLPVLQHAYAQTVHKSQGRTVDFTMVYGAAGLDASRAYVAMTRHRRDAVLFADAGAIGERMAADGKKPEAEAVRQAFLRTARGSADGVNAGDFVRDKAAWLRTGDHRAMSDAPRMSRIQFAMRRGEELATKAREAVAERIRGMQRGQEMGQAIARGQTAMREAGQVVTRGGQGMER